MKTNRHWLPDYCNPDALLPRIQETTTLFSQPPYLFRHFVGKAYSYLQSDEVRKFGFEFDPKTALPCKWKCSDESLFGVDLALYAQTGHSPFDKGMIGGVFNEASIGAAVHHGRINVDFGGSHVGYVPGDDGGAFGRIWRPQHGNYSTDCGHLSALLAPFQAEYVDASQQILAYLPTGGRTIVSVPSEFVQPNWSSRRVKLLVDTDTLTDGGVPFDHEDPTTHTPCGRTLFYLSDAFLRGLPGDDRTLFTSPDPTPIGENLAPEYFNVYDTAASLGADGLPTERLLLYMKSIIADVGTPARLKAAIVNTSLEHNVLTDTTRRGDYHDSAFASFSGVFIDIFDEATGGYINLFQPLGMSIKPLGVGKEVELEPAEVHEKLDRLPLAPQVMPLGNAMRVDVGERLVEKFTFRP